MQKPTLDPKLDLSFELTSTLPPEKIFQAWTQPNLLMQWFCPRPWKTVECKIDLRAGGQFYTVMQSPEGQKMPPGNGCYLEVVENRKIVWTSALSPGFRPQPPPTQGFVFTVHLFIEPNGTGSKYTAIAMHPSEEAREAHEKMGFKEGWGMAFKQLEELMGK